MKIIPNTPGGWIDFVQKVKEHIGRDLTDLEYKEIMQLYVKGKKPEDFKNDTE